MLYLTIIARISDNLPLAATMVNDNELPNIEQFKQQRKQLLKQLSISAPKQMTVETGSYNFHALTEDGVCYVTLCEKSYSSQLAYSFLHELKKEFTQLYGKDVDKVERPFAFLKFDKFIQDTIRVYSDTRTKRNLSKLKEELGEVQEIIKKNIKDLFDRGERLDSMADTSNEILLGSKKFRTSATNLNRMYYWKTYGPVVIVLSIVIFLLYIKRWLYP
jgi:vesicle transport protein SEC22